MNVWGEAGWGAFAREQQMDAIVAAAVQKAQKAMQAKNRDRPSQEQPRSTGHQSGRGTPPDLTLPLDEIIMVGGPIWVSKPPVNSLARPAVDNSCGSCLCRSCPVCLAPNPVLWLPSVTT